MARTFMKGALAALVALMACAGCAQRDIDPKADQVLRSMSRTLDAAQGLSFQAVGVMDEPARTGQLVQFTRHSRVVVRRPDGLFVDTTGDDVNRSCWYDGETLTLLNKTTKQYASIQAKNTIEKTHDYIVEEYGLTMPLADFIFSDAYKSMIAQVHSGGYVGLHEVNGDACHHLAFHQEDIDWQIWIDAGESAVPRKLHITYIDEAGKPGYTATLDQWDLAPKLSQELFKPVLPEGAKRVEMADLLGLEEGE